MTVEYMTESIRQACHPDLVLKSKKNTDLAGDIVETTVCRICNDIAEDAIESKCHHVFDRECIRQYLEAAVDTSKTVRLVFLGRFDT
jgi:DNA repair protein RAD16